MQTMKKCVWLVGVATLLTFVSTVTAQDKEPLKRDLAGEKKVTDYKVDPGKDKLEKTAAADAPKLGYVTTTRKPGQSSFDLAQGGVEHLVFANYMIVYPLAYKGETADGKYYVYQEANGGNWWWFFAKQGTSGKYTILFYAPGQGLFNFDNEAGQYTRTP